MADSTLKRISRLMAIVTAFQSRPLLTSTYLSEKFDVSVRTIYRDIKTLEDAGIPIYTIEGKGYSLMKHFNLPPISFTEEEANALVTANLFISNNRDQSFIHNHNAAIDKIQSILPQTNKLKSGILQARQYVVQEARKSNTNYLSSIQKAITNQTQIKIEYLSFYKSEKSIRVIDSYAIYNTRTYWIVVAWCNKQDSFREFRLDRILKLQYLAHQFEERTFKLEDYFQEKKNKFTTPDNLLSTLNKNFMENKGNMKKIRLAGISTRTVNDGRAMKDIPALWGKFMSKEIQLLFPDQKGNEVFCVYHTYDSDHTGPYTITLGYSIEESIEIGEGLEEVFIDKGQYEKFTAEGNIQQGSIWQAWQKIWGSDMKRSYKTDYEVYDHRAQDPTNAIVDIYVGIDSNN